MTNMWKISIMSLLVCMLLIVSYYLGGIKPEAYKTFNVVLYTFGGIFLLSTGFCIYELNKGKGKVQTKPVEVQ